MAFTFFSMDETFDIGRDTGTSVSKLYADKGEFEFHGKPDKVVMNVGAAAQELMEPYRHSDPSK